MGDVQNLLHIDERIEEMPEGLSYAMSSRTPGLPRFFRRQFFDGDEGYDSPTDVPDIVIAEHRMVCLAIYEHWKQKQ